MRIKKLQRIYAILTITSFSSIGYLIGHLLTMGAILFAIHFTIIVMFVLVFSHLTLMVVSSKIDKLEKEEVKD